VIPWLATSWTHTPDGLHWTAYLRRGVVWSDGAPFTSKDVIWTWDAMLDPAVGFPYAGMFAYVHKVTALGPYAVRFDLSTRNALFEAQALGTPILPEHILAKIPPGRLRGSSFGQQPIGTGPYVVNSWQHDDHIIFDKNPRWWRGAPKIGRLEILIVLNNEARIDALRDGTADLVDTMATADYFSLLQQDPKLEFVHLPGLYSYFVATNLRLPGISDLNVRRAMMYGWDRKRLTQGLLHDDAVVDDSIVPVGLPHWHDGNVTHYPFDPARARDTLEAAGWKLGADGVRLRGKDRLAFVLSMPNGNDMATDEAAEFQADMRAIGVDVSIKQLDFATFNDNLDNFKYELAFISFGGTTDPDEYTLLHSSQIAPVGNNFIGYRNAQVDRDLVLGLQALTDAQRKPYYDDIQRITSRTLPVLWGWDAYYRAAYSPRLHIDRKLMLPELSFWWNEYDWTLSR
jgi:peptide/nickel transport system substrate-binding protein